MENDSENDVLCEKIINEIHAVFVKDTDLSSFAIVPTSADQKNRSPVLHEDHNLGLESWCAKPVYMYAHEQILALKLANRYCHSDSIIKYVNIALLINSDVTTFWHIRRVLVEKNKLELHREFQFASLVLSVKPKSNEAFSYRRWLFSFRSYESIDWSFEIAICDRCGDRSSSNYHAWTHREWVIQKAPHLLKSEIIMTEKFIKKHISDYSCYHYRQFILKKLYEIRYFDKEQDLKSLIEFINFYVIDHVTNTNDILDTLLPGVDLKKIDNNIIKSFLFCCNIAAYDIKFCDESKNFYGPFESFDFHRRASLKFIVDNCKEFTNNSRYMNHNHNNNEHIKNGNHKNKDNNDDNQHDINGDINNDETMEYENQDHDLEEEPLNKVTKVENKFLLALKKSEGLLGEKHRRWCSIFLGFDYNQ
ncbi:protein prenyltransferase alpha subunit repeat-containing protein 1 [Condylostylus longicornis]|uniref:protein prenyltransferase alpha subunit repeat-containing protein 1 n=1 Tax=Condylostylus longicornis TaxID=2530218 RepID=UPI00244DB78C|nr:protein prenyltransferase alpha subunit repeat-containing protein 1 [Condylostylus longicornis]